MIVAAIALAATQGLPPASIDAIMAGARSCIAATSAAALDEAKLRADGWHEATMTSQGKPVANGLAFYSRDNLLLIVNHDGKTPLCSFSANLASSADYLRAQAALATAFGGDVGTDPVGEYVFIAPDRHMIDLSRTGRPDHPALRVAVMAMPQEKK